MRKVIVNSTPLLVLGNIGRLDILRSLYEQIEIPVAVYREVTEKNDAASKALLAASDWIKVRTVENIADYAMYQAKLHAGEVETMIIAQKPVKADLVILDDMAARKTAKYLGLTVTGTMGVLVKAKQKHIIPAVKPILDEIMRNGFYISEKIVKMVLKSVDEL